MFVVVVTATAVVVVVVVVAVIAVRGSVTPFLNSNHMSAFLPSLFPIVDGSDNANGWNVCLTLGPCDIFDSFFFSPSPTDGVR